MKRMFRTKNSRHWKGLNEMKLERIKFTNFKGASRSYNLGPLTVITGANFSGKTRILDAITFALAGYHPRCEKKNASIYEAFGGKGPLTVGAKLSDGIQIVRTLEKKGGSVTGDKSFAGITESQWQSKLPPVLLDANEYFGLSDRERVKMVFGIAKLGGENNSAQQIISGIQKSPLSSSDSTLIESIREACQEIEMGDQSRHAVDQSVQDWIAELAVDWGELKKSADMECKRHTASITANAQNQSEVKPVSSTIKTDIEKVRAELAALDKSIWVLRQKIDQNYRAQARKTEIENELSKADDGTLKKLEAEYEKSKVEDYKSGTSNLLVEEARLKGTATSLDMQISDLTRREKVLSAEHTETIAHKNCPICKSKGTSWRKRVETDYKFRWDEIQAALDRFKAQRIDNDAAMKEVMRALLRSRDEDLVHDNLGIKFHVLSTQLVGLRAELGRLPSVDSISLKTQLEELEQEREVKSKAIDAMTGEERRWIEYQANIKNRLTSEATQKKAAVELEVAKIVQKSVLASQAGLVETVFGTLLKTANSIAAPILKTLLEYQDGEIGRHEGEKFVVTSAFSGTEQTIAYAAMSIALAVQSPIRLCMIDECTKLDEVNKIKLAHLLVDLQLRGVIDQAILVDTESEPWCAVDGLEIIAL